MKKYPLFFAALTLFMACTCYAQKVTVDPNVGLASESAEAAVPDSRLAQKVTYEAWHTPLKTILADLSRSTGVTLNSGYSKQDWQVRDRKMNVYVKDVTLAQLMNSISRVMKFKWSCNDDKKPPTYRLVADRRLLSELQAEARKRERELHAEEIRRRTALVEEFARAAKTSGAELELLKKENPYLGLCATTGFAKMVTAMFSEQPKLREMFVNAERMTVMNASEFSEETRKLCVDVMRYGQNHFADRKAVPDDAEESLAKHRLHFEIIPKPYEWGLRRRLVYFGWINAALSEWITSIHFVGDFRYPAAESSKVVGSHRLSVANQPLESQTDWDKLRMDENNGMREDEKFIEWYLMFDPIVEHSDEADLHKNVTVEVTAEAQKDMMEMVKVIGGRSYQRLVYQASLKAIAEAAKMSIVSDSYSVLLGNNPSFGKDELKGTLDKLADTCRCNWEKHGSMIEFRRRDWFRRRSCQLPDEWVRAWREQVEKNACFDLDTCIRISALPDDQMEENIRIDPLLDEAIGISWEVDFHKIFCRFYIQLTPSQRAQVFSEDGFELSGLISDQLPAYREMFVGGWHPVWGQEALGDPFSTSAKIVATSRIAAENGVQCYDFHVGGTGEDGKELYHGWSIPLRKVVRLQDVNKTQ